MVRQPLHIERINSILYRNRSQVMSNSNHYSKGGHYANYLVVPIHYHVSRSCSCLSENDSGRKLQRGDFTDSVVTTSTGRSLWKVVDNRLSHRDEVISIGDISDIVSLGEMLWIAYGAEIQCVRPYETNPIGMVLYLSSGSTPVRCAVHFPYIYALTDEALTVFDIAHGTRRILPFMRRIETNSYTGVDRCLAITTTDFGSIVIVTQIGNCIVLPQSHKGAVVAPLDFYTDVAPIACVIIGDRLLVALNGRTSMVRCYSISRHKEIEADAIHCDPGWRPTDILRDGDSLIVAVTDEKVSQAYAFTPTSAGEERIYLFHAL